DSSCLIFITHHSAFFHALPHGRATATSFHPDSLAARAASLRLAETLRRVRRFNRRSVGARGVLRVEVAAAREDFGQCVEVENEADGWLAPTEVGRQLVVAPAAPHPRARALDVNLEDAAC